MNISYRLKPTIDAKALIEYLLSRPYVEVERFLERISERPERPADLDEKEPS